MYSKEDLDKAVKQYREYKTIQKEAETQIQEASKVIKSYMIDNDLQCLSGNDYEIKYTEASKTSLDTKALIAAFGDLLSKFQKITTFYKLNIH